MRARVSKHLCCHTKPVCVHSDNHCAEQIRYINNINIVWKSKYCLLISITGWSKLKFKIEAAAQTNSLIEKC